jgi:hypothetical protein
MRTYEAAFKTEAVNLAEENKRLQQENREDTPDYSAAAATTLWDTHPN